MIDPVRLLQELIRIPSSDPPGGELAVARHLHDVLTGIGIESRLDEFLPGRANVVARVKGRGDRPALVFSSHMDTLPVGVEPWSFDPFGGDLVDGEVRGRGATDMKSALAAFVAAAEELHRGATLGGDVILMFTAGESANCIGARRLVAEGAQREIGAFLCGEPSDLDLVIVEKAILWLRATATGRVGHVSGGGGVNAIHLMMEALAALRGVVLDTPAHPLLTGPSLSVGRIEGGTAVNLTPDRSTAEIDVRFAPGISAEAVLAQLLPVLPEGVTLEITDFKPAVEEPADSGFLALCADAVRAETGQEPRKLGVSYYSDGAILLDGLSVPFAILGPGRLGHSGSRDEAVSAAAVRQAARLYAVIARAWLGPTA
jgi:succinyl-diaminopimelate desuccinylase